MKSQMIEGMMRCFIAERGILMFICMFVGGFVNSLIYSLLVSYNTGVLGVCSLSVACLLYTSLILDLQGNGGGYLNAAIDSANEFLGKKELIVYTEGSRNPRSEFFAKGTG